MLVYGVLARCIIHQIARDEQALPPLFRYRLLRILRIQLLLRQEYNRDIRALPRKQNRNRSTNARASFPLAHHSSILTNGHHLLSPRNQGLLPLQLPRREILDKALMALERRRLAARLQLPLRSTMFSLASRTPHTSRRGHENQPRKRLCLFLRHGRELSATTLLC